MTGPLLYAYNVHRYHPPLHPMSVTLQPSNSIGFNRVSSLFSSDLFSPSSFLTFAILQGPLTQNVKRSLNITNPNADLVSFKIYTTTPKVRPSRV